VGKGQCADRAAPQGARRVRRASVGQDAPQAVHCGFGLGRVARVARECQGLGVGGGGFMAGGAVGQVPAHQEPGRGIGAATFGPGWPGRPGRPGRAGGAGGVGGVRCAGVGTGTRRAVVRPCSGAGRGGEGGQGIVVGMGRARRGGRLRRGGRNGQSGGCGTGGRNVHGTSVFRCAERFRTKSARRSIRQRHAGRAATWRGERRRRRPACPTALCPPRSPDR